MKRGLVEAVGEHRDVYAARLDRLRDRLRGADAQVALIYGDVYRSDDIAHLTNLCIYWNEGVVAVPVDGPPVFLAKLSKRVHPWMQRTSILEDLRASQQLPKLIGAYLDELDPGAIAFVDRDWWPAELVDGIVGEAPSRQFLDLPDAVRSSRLVPDELDRADLERAGSLVALALAAAVNAGGAAEERLAVLELAARSEGARDVLASCREIDGGFQTECAVQFANVWAYGARHTVGGESLRSVLDAAAGSLRAGATVDEVQAVTDGAASVSIVSHCDLATGGDLRLTANSGGVLVDGQAVSLTVRAGDVLLADTYVLAGERVTAITQTTAEVAA
jgi:hypothetical protein